MQQPLLRSILKDQELCNVFEEFLVQRLCWENLSFCQEVDHFKTCSEDVRPNVASEIFHSFVKAGAPLEIGDSNIYFEESIEPLLAKAPATLFDQLQEITFRNLAATSVQPFLRGNLYRKYQEHVLGASKPKPKPKLSRLSSSANSLQIPLLAQVSRRLSR